MPATRLISVVPKSISRLDTVIAYVGVYDLCDGSWRARVWLPVAPTAPQRKADCNL